MGSNLPKQVSAIKSVPTIFHTNAGSLDTSLQRLAPPTHDCRPGR